MVHCIPIREFASEDISFSALSSHNLSSTPKITLFHLAFHISIYSSEALQSQDPWSRLLLDDR